MPTRCVSSLFRVGAALALVVVVAGCTKGGQFDPTELMNVDMFDTKKKLQGQREPVFPEGVPGVTNGVPPDLVKGYQPPPEQAAAGSDAAPAAAAAVAEKPKPTPKPTPKPKVARAAHSPVGGKMPPRPRTQISVGMTPKPGATAKRQQAPAQANWPAAAGQQAAQPAAQPAQPAAQAGWPLPQAGPPAQQTAQPAWPNPPPPGTVSR